MNTCKKLLVLAVVVLGFSQQPVAQKVQPSWQSINERGYPQWFADAKLGIFIHWGVYSVPAYAGVEGYGEWYYRGLMVGDTVRINFQNKTYGEGITYRDFDKLFKAELWNPAEWADIFKQSGIDCFKELCKAHKIPKATEYNYNRLNKYFEEVCLVDQGFIKENNFEPPGCGGRREAGISAG